MKKAEMLAAFEGIDPDILRLILIAMLLTVDYFGKICYYLAIA